MTGITRAAAAQVIAGHFNTSATHVGGIYDNSLDIQIRIAEIDAEFKAMLQAIATDTVEDFDE